MRNFEVSGHIAEPVAMEYIAYALNANPTLEPRTCFGFDVEFEDIIPAAKLHSSERLARVVMNNQTRTVVAVAIVTPLASATFREVPGAASAETILQIQDFVSSHGLGDATEEGIELALDLMAQGDDVATAAAEVVARGHTIDPDQ